MYLNLNVLQTASFEFALELHKFSWAAAAATHNGKWEQSPNTSSKPKAKNILQTMSI